MPQDQYVTLATTLRRQFETPDGRGGYATASMDVDAFLREFDQSVTLNRYSPVLQKRIGTEYQKNIEITGSFRTNCDMSNADVNGGFSFITVRKESYGKASAYSGYGFAWRPSYPSYNSEISIIGAPTISSMGNGYYDIPVTADPESESLLMYLSYIDTSEKKIYVPFNYASYADGKLIGCYLPTVAPLNTHKICHMSPNIYICDNNPSHGDMYASKYIMDPLTGLSYIQSATMQILPDVTYYFKISIKSDNAIEVYLQSTSDDFSSSSPVIISGATTPISEYMSVENMDSFGISVYDTCGYQWWYDNLKISKLGGEYPVSYFRFDVTDMPEDLQIEISAYGLSEDNGIMVKVRDHEGAGKWDSILTASVEDYTVMVTNIISKAKYAQGGVIDIMVTTISPSTPETPATIYIDYIKAVRAMVSGVHMGGCVDVYIDDPSAYLRSVSQTIDETTGSLAVPGIYNISSISVNDIELLYAKDYVISEADPCYSNSILSSPVIKFAPDYYGEEATVSYWDSDAVTSAQSLMNDDSHRPLGLNVLVKHKSIHEITISPDDALTESYIASYMEDLQYLDGVKSIVYTDIAKYIYSETGSYSDVTLFIKYFDGSRMKYRTLSTMGQEYKIEETETYRIV